MNKPCSIAGIFLFILLITQNCLALELLPDHTAKYDLLKKNIIVASASFSLQHKQDMLTYSLDIHISGLFSLFRDDTYHEESSLKIINNKLELLHYKLEQTGSKNRQVDISVDTDKKLISGHNNQQSISISYLPPLYDRMSIQLKMIDHVRNSKQNTQLDFFDGDTIKQYQFDFLGYEDIELTEDNWVRTMKWQTTRKDSNRKNIYWFSPGHRYLPVQIEQFHNDKLDTTLILSKISWTK